MIRKNLFNDETAFLFLNENLVTLKVGDLSYVMNWLNISQLSGVSSNISAKTISKVTTMCPNLKTISLYSVTNARPESLIALFKCLPGLEGVNLAKCPLATEGVLVSLAHSCPGLKRFASSP